MAPSQENHTDTDVEMESVSGDGMDSSQWSPTSLDGDCFDCRRITTGETVHSLNGSEPTPSEVKLPCEPTPTPMLLVPSTSDPRVTNLAHFRDTRPVAEPFQESSFTQVRRLAGAIYGDVSLQRWSRPDQVDNEIVAVKRLDNKRMDLNANKETDEHKVHRNPACGADAEDPLTEIGVLAYLGRQQDRPEYILKMLGVFADTRHTYLVTEFADGGELFEVVAKGTQLPEVNVLRYTWQLLHAVEYLHKHWVAHRDISLENILVLAGSIRLMDFAMAVQSHSSSGTPLRYFRPAGKDFYRSPECYVPVAKTINVIAPANCVAHAADAGSCPEGRKASKPVMAKWNNYLCEVMLPHGATVGQECLAEVWGYGAQAADMWSCAICLFILCFKSPCWQRALLNDNAFGFAYGRGDGADGGVAMLLRAWGKASRAAQTMALLYTMLRFDPADRPSAAECLEHACFQQFECSAAKAQRIQ
jgi:serine/threonine protein kinase